MAEVGWRMGTADGTDVFLAQTSAIERKRGVCGLKEPEGA